jgi:hypothetical protein
LAARYPDYTSTDIRHLSRNGDTIILCAGPKDDLVCRALKDGKQLWRVQHVWEFERSFVGPSVWQHFIGRSDSSPLSAKEAFPDPRVERPLKASEKRGGAPKKEEAGSTESAIIGGPIVFNSRVFVAVSKAPSGPWAGYLGQCWIYELEAIRGSPVSLAAIPRAVLGGQYEPTPDGLVWACHRGCFLKLNIVSDAIGPMGMGPGGPDRVSNVVWYRETQPKQPAVWLSADPATEAIAWQRNYVFRTTEGGYITKAGDTLYHFPISVVDTKTGLDRVIELTVPLREAITPPKSNYSWDLRSYKVKGPHLVGITRLDASGSTLRISLGSGKKANGIEFSLPQIEAEFNKGK